MTSRLSIINSALIMTGNEQCAVEFDGSDQWTVAYCAYERAIPVILERGKFNFSTTTQTLARLSGPPAAYERWKSAFAKPAGCLMLVDVRVDGIGVGYDIVDDQILTMGNAAEAVFVREPAQSTWPHLLVETATLYVEAGCARGLNEDYEAAKDRERRADAMFDTTHTRTDQQKPPRAMHNSRIRARMRRGGGTYRGL